MTNIRLLVVTGVFALSCLEPVWLKIPNLLNVTDIKNDISGTAARR